MESHGKDQDVSKNTVAPPTPAVSGYAEHWPRMPLYYTFHLCTRNYVDVNENKLYHRICNYIYSTDGLKYYGYIKNGEFVRVYSDMNLDREEPDHIYCPCCMEVYLDQFGAM